MGHAWSIEELVELMEAGLTDDSFTVSREQAKEIFRALHGINNLLKGLVPKSGNAAELYAIMSNLAVIQANLTGMPRVNSN